MVGGHVTALSYQPFFQPVFNRDAIGGQYGNHLELINYILSNHNYYAYY